MNRLRRAIEIASAAHAGRTDSTGRPFMAHIRRVARRIDTVDGKTVAYLHDVLEKSGWTEEDLRAEGFDASILSAVEALTRRDGEDYFDFARRAASDRLARPVKLADLRDHVWQAAQTGTSPEKYKKALRLIEREFVR